MTLGPDARRSGWRIPDDVKDAAWLWLVLRIALGLVGLLLFIAGSAAQPCSFDLNSNGWTTFPPLSDQGASFPLAGVWQHNDACWYAKIAAHGYEAGQSSTAFFPLLPMLMRAGSYLTGGDVALAGIIVNGVAFVIAIVGLSRLVRADFGRDVADRTVLYLAAFPAAFFLFAPFTEALFLASAVWALIGARNRDWTLAGVAAALAALTRLHGLLLVLPLAWEAVKAYREHRHAGGRLRASDLAPFLAAAVPIVIVAAWYAYTAGVVGQSFVEAQALWGGATIRWPWELTAETWDRVTTDGDSITLLNAVTFVVFTALGIVGIRHLPATYSLYVLPSIALIILRAPTFPFMSAMRYAVVLFPCFVVLALLGRSSRFHTAWLVGSMLLLGYLTTLFVQGEFIG